MICMIPCACCGFHRLSGVSESEICPICYWDNDRKNTERGGPNNLVSLKEAKFNFLELGASDLLWIGEVRGPLPEESSIAISDEHREILADRLDQLERSPERTLSREEMTRRARSGRS